MVIVTDGTNKAIGGAGIQLNVTQPWSLKETVGTTPAGGQFVTEFLPTKTSGIAVITATVTVPGVTTVPLVQTYSQNITADLPAKVTDSYPNTASVGAVTDITVQVMDQYGNPITSTMKKTMVNFTTTSGGNNAFLIPDPSNVGNEITVKSLPVALNDSGFADVNFALTTHPGDNFILITPPNPLTATLIDIQGIPNLPPSSITQTVIPDGNPPTLSADGKSKFTINYQLYDRYGNPSTYHTLSISTNAGEMMNISSNSEGNVTMTYGPKNTPGDYTITAIAVDDPTNTATQIVRFASEDPTNMILTASPQSMASSDQNNQSISTVMAKVTDTFGNPVQGQIVYFSIQGVDVGSFVQTSEPAIESGTSIINTIGSEIPAVTDKDGYASVEFYPGAFTTDLNNPGYSAAAEGIAIIGARWSGFTRDINLSYKNYPYLSVSTFVNPKTVTMNGTVDVSILVKGDGYLLQPRPIDVLLATDRSGSMSSDIPTRISQVQSASKTFVAQLDYSKDQVGLVSFGNDASVDEHLSNSASAINNTIDSMIAGGNTPTREALYQAINEINTNGRTGTIKAIILLTDGDYNAYGDPLARGLPSSEDPSQFNNLELDYVPMNSVSSQNMAEYAKTNNIRIYTIGIATDISQGGQDTLQQIASITNGEYFYSPTENDLNSIYTQIAGDLKDTAGVNTTMDLNFQRAGVNGVSTNGSDVLEYVYNPGSSTYILPPPPASPWTENSTAAWDENQQLQFQSWNYQGEPGVDSEFYPEDREERQYQNPRLSIPAPLR